MVAVEQVQRTAVNEGLLGNILEQVENFQRVIASIERHGANDNPGLAQDFVAALASDHAVTCVEYRDGRLLAAAALVAALLAGGCDTSFNIDIGAIRVTVTAVGNNIDADGYVIQVTGSGENQSQRVDANGQVAFAVQPALPFLLAPLLPAAAFLVRWARVRKRRAA